MEAWTDPARIASAMATILEIEAEAARAVSCKGGLVTLLSLLKERKASSKLSVTPCSKGDLLRQPCMWPVRAQR